MRFRGIIAAGVLALSIFGASEPAAATIIPVIPLPVPTIIIPGPIKTVLVPGPTVTKTLPPVIFYRTTPGPTKTVVVPSPVSTVEIVKTKTVYTPSPAITTTAVKTVTVTSTRQVTHESVKIVTSAPKSNTRYIQVSIPKAVGISIALFVLGVILTLLALYVIYRVGQREGLKAGERKGLIAAKRILERR